MIDHLLGPLSDSKKISILIKLTAAASLTQKQYKADAGQANC